MNRLTISLPTDMADALAREARRRGVPVSQIAREAIAARLGRPAGARRELPFASVGRSGHHTTSEDVDAILAVEWSNDRDR